MGRHRAIALAVRTAVAAGINLSVLALIVGAVAALPWLALGLYHPEPAAANLLWIVTAVGCTLVLLFVFSSAIVRTLRTERRALLDGTTPITAASAEDTDTVEQTVQQLAAQAAIPVPAVRVHPSVAPFAYTTYRPSDRLFASTTEAPPVLVVSSGLIEQCSHLELKAIIAHEIAHIANDDLWLFTWLLVPLVAAEKIQEEYDRPVGVLDLAGIVLGTIAVIGLGVLSRRRELVADQRAAELLGDQRPLIAGLLKIEESVTEPPSADLRNNTRLTNAVSCVPVVQTDREQQGIRSTHPPTARRIERLQSLDLSVKQ